MVSTRTLFKNAMLEILSAVTLTTEDILAADDMIHQWITENVYTVLDVWEELENTAHYWYYARIDFFRNRHQWLIDQKEAEMAPTLAIISTGSHNKSLIFY